MTVSLYSYNNIKASSFIKCVFLSPVKYPMTLPINDSKFPKTRKRVFQLRFPSHFGFQSSISVSFSKRCVEDEATFSVTKRNLVNNLSSLLNKRCELIQEEKLRHWKVAELTLTVSNISGIITSWFSLSESHLVC
ncbi:hypothetical protein CFP56_013321 [Quercus suber]|uniref:Uncharacterized protein n=1 Tax=Quercus suber TaxID=58331 RepID=A0AAW0KUJ3_QUESU